MCLRYKDTLIYFERVLRFAQGTLKFPRRKKLG